MTGLGYSNKEAELALENALQGLGHSPSEKDLPEILKLALAQSGRSK